MRTRIAGLKGLLLAQAAAALLVLSAAPVSAQQLYVAAADVYHADSGDPFCNAHYTNPSGACHYSDGCRSYGTTVLPSDGVTPVEPMYTASRIEYDQPINHAAYPGGCLALCATINCVNTQSGTTNPAFGIDSITFEVFKNAQGSNSLDPASSPPVKTLSMLPNAVCPSNAGLQSDGVTVEPYEIGTYCSGWDGRWNIDGLEGKTNGQYGYRATVKTNQTGTTIGNISIENTLTFPRNGMQYPMTMDVVNIHSNRSTVTTVGTITAVSAAPYNIQYRLSKDATTTITLEHCDDTGQNCTFVDTIDGPANRQGESTTNLTNGASWTGRDHQGRLLAGTAGIYVYEINAWANDKELIPGVGGGKDVAAHVRGSIGLDPLQMTDIRIKALGPNSTDVATITYLVTEAATGYARIYPPGTYFDSTDKFVNCGDNSYVPGHSNPAVCGPQPVGGTAPIFESVGQQPYRQAASVPNVVWDGRSNVGWDGHAVNRLAMDDGSYVYAIWAETPGYDPATGGTTIRSKLFVGNISINRGAPVAFLQMSSAVIGSTGTAVAALNPFQFGFTFNRPCSIDFNILTSTLAVVRRLKINEAVSDKFANVIEWDGLDDYGRMVSSGTYMAEMLAYDPLFPSKPPFSMSVPAFTVDLFRITDVNTTPLLSGTSPQAQATISYLLSQPMNTTVSIYPSTNVDVNGPWPPVVGVLPVKTFTHPSAPGRFRITEYWDGNAPDGTIMQPDGDYTVVIAAKSNGPVAVYDAAANKVTVDSNFYAPDHVVKKLTISRGDVGVNNYTIIPTIPTLTASSEPVKLPPFEISFDVTRLSSVTIRVLSTTWCGTSKVCKYIVSGKLYDAGLVNHEFWDGTNAFGQYLPADAYTIQLIAYNYPGENLYSATTVQQTPQLNNFQVYDLSINDLGLKTGKAAINYQLSVPMKVAVQVFKPGTTIDGSGNPSPPIASGSLVKVLMGMRPMQTLSTEEWDGTDMTMRPVPDGNYVFRIVTSTDAALIDPYTGAIAQNNIANVADQQVYLTPLGVSVSRGDSTDPCADLEAQAMFYPNPIRQSRGCFDVGRAPVPGTYSLRLYNVAGDRVFDYQWAGVPAQKRLQLDWDRTNSAGKKLARGIYFATFELKGNMGSTASCQLVRKILIPSSADGAAVASGCAP
ncbi:MAG: hypothetical protein PHP45_03855 [Elusimicrobiales bacterium]|nr:hypothetical protein [Elusimicrobiales bacterium]